MKAKLVVNEWIYGFIYLPRLSREFRMAMMEPLAVNALRSADLPVMARHKVFVFEFLGEFDGDRAAIFRLMRIET